MKFEPTTKTPTAANWQLRVNKKDLETLKRIAKEKGESPAEIARQAISYALKSMEDEA